MILEKNKAISIIIPHYNQGMYILDAIKSVENCNPDLYEVIIVDDGSTDKESIQTIKSLEKKGYFIIWQENKGLAEARNVGIRQAKGKYILPLDSDNKIRPDYLEEGIRILDQNPKIGVVYGNAEFFGEREGIWERPDFEMINLIGENFIDACAVFRKSLWVDVDGYDIHPDPPGYEDWDFWLKAATCGWGFHHVDKVLFDYRIRNEQMSRIAALPENQDVLIPYLYTKHYKFIQRELVKAGNFILKIKKNTLFNAFSKSKALFRKIK